MTRRRPLRAPSKRERSGGFEISCGLYRTLDGKVPDLMAHHCFTGIKSLIVSKGVWFAGAEWQKHESRVKDTGLVVQLFWSECALTSLQHRKYVDVCPQYAVLSSAKLNFAATTVQATRAFKHPTLILDIACRAHTGDACLMIM